MIEIRGTNANDPAGELDEVVADNCGVHLERMSKTDWCLILEQGGHRVHVSLGYARPGGGFGFIVEDDAKATLS